MYWIHRDDSGVEGGCGMGGGKTARCKVRVECDRRWGMINGEMVDSVWGYSWRAMYVYDVRMSMRS